VLPGGPVWQPYSYSVPSPHRLFKIPAQKSDYERKSKIFDSWSQPWIILRSWIVLAVFGIHKFLRLPDPDFRFGSGSFHNQAKMVRKPLISTVLWLLYDLLSLKNDVNLPSKVVISKKLLLASWRLLTKRAGIGAVYGSAGYRYGSTNPLLTGTDPRIRIRVCSDANICLYFN
jgi:hypothetical protein